MREDQRAESNPLATLLAYLVNPPPEWRAAQDRFVQLARAGQAWESQLRRYLDAINAAVEVWAPQLRKANEAFLALAERFRPIVEQLARIDAEVRRLVLRVNKRQLARAIERLAPSDEVLAEYCRPYEREIEKVGLPPLSDEERSHFYLVGWLLDPRDWRLGARPPLLPLALAADRVDVATADVVRRGLHRRVAAGLADVGVQDRDDLEGEAVLGLHAQTLPYLAKKVKRVPVEFLQQYVDKVTRDSYLMASIARNLRQVLKTDRLEREREELHRVKLASAGAVPHIPDIREWGLAIKEAAKSFAARPDATELDRKMVRVFLREPSLRASAIAREIGAPTRTVQSRYGKMRKYIKQRFSDMDD